VKVPQSVGRHGSTNRNLFGVHLEQRKGKRVFLVLFCFVLFCFLGRGLGSEVKAPHPYDVRTRDCHQTGRIQGMMGERVVSCHREGCHLASTSCHNSRIGCKFGGARDLLWSARSVRNCECVLNCLMACK